MIKTVIFDLGGVIVPLDFSRGYTALSRLCRYSADEIPARIGATGLVPALETGRIEPAEFHRRISELLGLSLSYGEFVRVWGAIFLPGALLPESMLLALRRRRRRLLLLSNTNAIHFAFIEDRYPLLRHFDDYILSYRVGRMKPDAEIYRAAVIRARCQPRECLFIDDLASNVAGARRVGIDAVQFYSPVQLAAELRCRGLET